MTRSFYSRGLHDPYLDLNAQMLGVGGRALGGASMNCMGGGVDIEFLYSCCFTGYAAFHGVLINYDLLEKIKSYSFVNFSKHISHVTSSSPTQVSCSWSNSLTYVFKMIYFKIQNNYSNSTVPQNGPFLTPYKTCMILAKLPFVNVSQN